MVDLLLETLEEGHDMFGINSPGRVHIPSNAGPLASADNPVDGTEKIKH